MIRRRPKQEYMGWVWGNEVLITGELKMVETVPLLADEIECISTVLNPGIGDNENFWQRPAVVALISMGTPSISAVVGVLAHGDRIERQEAAYVLGHIDAPSARQALEAALPKETDPEVRRYIQNGLHPPKPRAVWTPPKP